MLRRRLADAIAQLVREGDPTAEAMDDLDRRFPPLIKPARGKLTFTEPPPTYTSGLIVDSIADLLGSRQAATEAVQAVFEAIARAVAEGDRVMVTGFGSFERAERAARYARNPQTGEPVFLKETSVPKFRPGQGFKDLASGSKKLPRGGKPAVRKAPKGSLTGSARPTAKKATKAGAKEATAAKESTVATTTAAKKATAKKAPAKKATAKKAPSKAATKSASAKARQ